MTDETTSNPDSEPKEGPEDGDKATATDAKKPDAEPELEKEVGGRKGPEPTRYSDWEKNGIISDF